MLEVEDDAQDESSENSDSDSSEEDGENLADQVDALLDWTFKEDGD